MELTKKQREVLERLAQPNSYLIVFDGPHTSLRENGRASYYTGTHTLYNDFSYGPVTKVFNSLIQIETRYLQPVRLDFIEHVYDPKADEYAYMWTCWYGGRSCTNKYGHESIPSIVWMLSKRGREILELEGPEVLG